MRVRPHAKTHKCPEVGKRQIALGAVGMCCQKVSEAEAMVDGGIADVLVSNEVVGAPKLARLAELSRRARIGVCVDNADEPARDRRVAARSSTSTSSSKSACAAAASRPGEPAVALAREIGSTRTCASAGCRPTTAARSTCAAWRSATR